MRKLPVFYFRSTVITIDDKPMVSETLSLLLSDKFNVKSFDRPSDFLRFIADYRTPLSNDIAFQLCTEHENYDTARHMIVDFDVSKLHALIQNEERNNEISVIIVDYRMPELNGLSVCKMIKRLHVRAKIILLTGEANLQTAIDAFNENIIDQFIEKSSPTLSDDIIKAVTELSHQYYNEKTL